MVAEVLTFLRPVPGDVAVDCTLGGGGHARAILERLQPGGRLIALDVDPFELPRTEAHLRAAGFGPDTFVARHGTFAGLPQVLAGEGVAQADVILADLGVSSMQLDNPDRGFSYKAPGPLDMRMNPSRGESAAQLLGRVSEEKLARLLEDNADEPHADLIARLLKTDPPATTQALDRLVRAGLGSAHPDLGKPDLKLSVRRTLQALRIEVNGELSALDALLRSLPHCLSPAGRVVILTFHSGEDRRVKKAFQAGVREGIYSAVARDVIRSTTEELHANRRAQAAKLRWAVRGTTRERA
jgi:16S rRNA (cytosine1402-N4)-methyltransferase